MDAPKTSENLLNNEKGEYKVGHRSDSNHHQIIF